MALRVPAERRKRVQLWRECNAVPEGLSFFFFFFSTERFQCRQISRSLIWGAVWNFLFRKKKNATSDFERRGGRENEEEKKIIHSINVRYAEDTNDCIIVGNFTSVLTRVDLANYRMNEWSKYECNNPTTVITMLNCPVNCGL